MAADYFSKLASRKDNGEVRKEKQPEPHHPQSLWGNNLSWPINQAYTPYAIQNVNRYSSIADFFNNHPLRKLTLEQEDDKCQMVNPPTYDIQKEFDVSLGLWQLRKDDVNNYISDISWNTIVELVKDSLSPRFIYATTYINKIYIKKQNPKKKEQIKEEVIDLLGLYEHHNLKRNGCKITLFYNEIKDAALIYNLPFELIAAQVLLHELGHHIMAVESAGTIKKEIGEFAYKTAEESCANLITLICFEKLVKDNKIYIAAYDAIVRFMQKQPSAYQHGPMLMENAPWEWLKWKILKQSYDGYAHRMPTEDGIMSVDGKPMYFHKHQEKMLNQNNNKS